MTGYSAPPAAPVRVSRAVLALGVLIAALVLAPGEIAGPIGGFGAVAVAAVVVVVAILRRLPRPGDAARQTRSPGEPAGGTAQPA